MRGDLELHDVVFAVGNLELLERTALDVEIERALTVDPVDHSRKRTRLTSVVQYAQVGVVSTTISQSVRRQRRDTVALIETGGPKRLRQRAAAERRRSPDPRRAVDVTVWII